MTAEIELLPLPEGYDKYSPPRLYGGQMFHEGQMRAYARANSARAIAPLQAEVEALRDEAERLREVLEGMVSWFPSADTYRRLGFDPKTPMQVLKEAKATLAKEDK